MVVYSQAYSKDVAPVYKIPCLQRPHFTGPPYIIEAAFIKTIYL